MNDSSPKQSSTNTSKTTKSSPTEFFNNRFTDIDPLCVEYLRSPVCSKSVGEFPKHLTENSPHCEQRLFTPLSCIARTFEEHLPTKQETITYEREPEPFVYPIKPAWCCDQSNGYDTKYFRYDREAPQFRSSQLPAELAFNKVPVWTSPFRTNLQNGNNVHSTELVYHQAYINRPIYSFRCFCHITYLNLVLYIQNKYRFL